MNSKSFKSILVNPYVLNGVVWLVVFLVYQLGWSGLCPPLSEDMNIFLAITILVSGVLGIITFIRKPIEFRPLRNVSLRPVTIWTALIWIMFLAEGVASGGFPLMSYVTGSMSVTYKEFGLPVVHVIVVNGLAVIIVYSYYAIRSISDKKKKRKLYLLILLCLFSFLLQFNRGAILSSLLGMFFIMFLSSRRPLKVLMWSLVGSIGVLFAFGALGNLRMGKNMRSLILKVGQASVEFERSSIPDEFFWGYIYIATPLANTQNTINRAGTKIVDSEDVSNMILYEFTPEIISKRIVGQEDRVRRQNAAMLITDNLNAVSVYGRAYRYMGWTGMWTMFVFLLIFIYVNLRIVSSKSKWYIPTIVILNIIVTMNLFDNMFVFMGSIPQLAIVVGINYYQKWVKRGKEVLE